MPPWIVGLGLAALLIIGVGAWFSQRTKVRKLRSTFNQMADQLQAKIRELEASRSQIEGILQGMSEGVLAVDSHGQILLMNSAARQILEMGPQVHIGQVLTEAVRSPQIQALVHQVQANGKPCSQDVTLYVPSERHLRIHATTGSSAPDDSTVLLVIHDITDLKRLENLRREFVANVSHELKTPLTAIQGAVETLLDGAMSDPANSRSFLESIAEETTRLHRLVEDLLTLAQVESKPAAFHREAVNIRPLLEAQVNRYQALAHAHQVSIQLEVPQEDHSLLADRDQLAQAVGNLLDNAIKYNHTGGQVTVRMSESSGRLRIEVEDSGIGIPPEDLPRIFERFYRVDKARSRQTGGTGLGLSIVKHAAEAHDGSVQVESRPDQGSRFTLDLPLH